MSAQRKKEKKNSKGPFGLAVGFKGPMGHVGPFGKFHGSGYGPIVLVSDLGNFRRLGNYINSTR